MNYFVDNFSPKRDAIAVTITNTNLKSDPDRILITVERDHSGFVYLSILDNLDGSESRMVLGEKDFTSML